MQALLTVGVRKRLGIAGWIAACSLFAISSPAQRPVARITTVVDDADRTTIYGTHPVMARTEDEAGRGPLGGEVEGNNTTPRTTPPPPPLRKTKHPNTTPPPPPHPAPPFKKKKKKNTDTI